MGKELELRMYGIVPYNISPIQQGIQFGHGVVEYQQIFPKGDYDKWALNHKTFIILNGGTTNSNPVRLGSMNKHLETLREQDIFHAEFYEPDLGDQLTAVVFLVDERVFNKEDYPDFKEYLVGQINDNSLWRIPEEKLRSEYHMEYEGWVESVGGEKNAFLKTFLKPLRLA